MSPRTEEQFEEIRSTRKLQIMEAALEVFASEGYHKASIAQIAKKAQISKGLMYNYFKSKEELLKAVLIEGVEGFKKSFDQIVDELDTPEELEIFIKGGMDIMGQNSHFYKLYFTVLFQPAAYQIVKENYQVLIGEILKEVGCYFQSKGDPHPMEKAALLAATMDGFGIHYLLAPEMYDLQIYEKLIFDLFK